MHLQKNPSPCIESLRKSLSVTPENLIFDSIGGYENKLKGSVPYTVVSSTTNLLVYGECCFNALGWFPSISDLICWETQHAGCKLSCQVEKMNGKFWSQNWSKYWYSFLGDSVYHNCPIKGILNNYFNSHLLHHFIVHSVCLLPPPFEWALRSSP